MIMQENKHNKSLIKRNILKYLNIIGVSKYEFYKNAGMSRGTLDNTSGLTEENILKFFAYAPDVRPEWLLTGKGEMLKSTTEYSEYSIEKQGISMDPRQQYKSARIPVYHVRNAGALVSLLERTAAFKTDDYILVPNLEACDGAVYINGDTMYPLLKSGDIVAYKIMVDKKNSILWGEMYLLAIELESEVIAMVGYIQKSEKGNNYIAVRSYNPQHELKDISLDQLLVFAHIKASIRIN